MEFLTVLIGIFFIIVAPALAVIAFIRVRKLEQQGTASLDNNLQGRLSTIEHRIVALEWKLHDMLASAGAERAPVRPEPPSPTPAPAHSPPSPTSSPQPQPKPVPPAQQAAHGAGLDFETRIAGRWLNRIGIIALLLATAFFLKYAFDNDWVGPHGKVAIGLLAGAGLLVYSQSLFRRDYHYFSDGIAGLGGGVLYLSLYAAWNFYHLIPSSVAFAGMIGVTSALIAIALGRDSQRIALLALAGGFLTPLLLSTGRDAQVELFTYLAILNAGLLAVASARDWRMLEPVALIGTIIYYAGWYEQFYADEKLVLTAFYATLFFVEFAALPVIRSRRDAKLPNDEVYLVLFNVTWYLVALHTLLYTQHRWALTIAILMLAAVHLGVTRLLPETETAEPPIARLLFAGLALTFVTLTIPVRLEGKWITMAWAMEGTVLVWIGFQTKVRLLRWAGLLLFAVIAFRLFAFPIPAERFLMNLRFAAFAVSVACFCTAYVFASRHEEDQSNDERQAFAVLGLTINVLSLWILSREVWDALDRMEASILPDRQLAQQLALSLLWIVYAALLIVLGVRQDSRALRLQALALFGLVVGKVFLYDLSSLERFYRIISFLVLGVVLLVVSFLYQRRLAAGRSEEKL